MKKLIIFAIALFFLNNCGYTPIYSSSDNNFYIKEISTKNKSKLNSKFENLIKRFSNQDSKNIINLEISSNKRIDIISKDTKGDPAVFNMTISITIKILEKNKIENFSESFSYNNDSNKFSLKQYEKEIENTLINKIVEKTKIYISEI